MAVTAVTPLPIELNGMTNSSGTAAAITFPDGNTDGTEIAYGKQDTKIVVVFNASAASTATVKAGTMIQGVADLSLTIPSGVSCCVLDSGYFKNASGKVKIVPAANTTKIAAVALP